MQDFDPKRLDAEWSALNAVREMLLISGRNTAETTYDESLALAAELLPQLFHPDKSLIARGHEPPVVREYRQMAEAQSVQTSKRVLPEDLLADEIARIRLLLPHSKSARDIKRRLNRLESHKKYFSSKTYTEHQLIRRDFQIKPGRLPEPIPADNCNEFELGNSQYLRVRMLHPDKPEHATGADLVYEVVNDEHSKVRFVFLQYKIWDGERLYFSSAGNLDAQIAKLEKVICKGGYCDTLQNCTPPHGFRLPHCAAFLRLTDRLQAPDARLISSGLHVPVCVVSDIGSDQTKSVRMLNQGTLHSRSISANVFEELFRTEMLGSEWMPCQKAEEFYQRHHILKSDERIVVYAQQYKGL